MTVDVFMKCHACFAAIAILIFMVVCATAVCAVILLEHRQDRQDAVVVADEIKAEIAKIHKELVKYNKKVYWWEGGNVEKE